jgi:hypothetical protein
LLGLLPALAGAAQPRRVDLSASVSGSTLTVDVKADAHSKCAFQLGSGRGPVKLPKGTTGARGRGRITFSLPSDAPRGRRAVSATCTHGTQKSFGKTFVAIPRDLSGSNSSDVIATVLNVVLDVILGGSLVLFAWLLINMVVRASNERERLMRALALIGGALIALGAQAAGVSFASYTIDTLTGARPGGEGFKLVSAVVPGGVSAFFGWYFVRVMRRSADMGLRLMSFLGMLTVVAFAVIFAQATSTQGVALGAAAIPNASFVAGLIFGVVVFMPADDASSEKGKRFGGVRDMFRRRVSRNTPLVSEGPHDTPAAPVTRNPFADD